MQLKSLKLLPTNTKYSLIILRRPEFWICKRSLLISCLSVKTKRVIGTSLNNGRATRSDTLLRLRAAALQKGRPTFRRISLSPSLGKNVITLLVIRASPPSRVSLVLWRMVSGFKCKLISVQSSSLFLNLESINGNTLVELHRNVASISVWINRVTWSKAASPIFVLPVCRLTQMPGPNLSRSDGASTKRK